MKTLNYPAFRQNLEKTLNEVTNDSVSVVVSLANGKSLVVKDLDEYNPLTETLYIAKSEPNKKRLQETVDGLNNGIFYRHQLIESN